MCVRFGRLDTELDGEPTMDNNSAGQPPGTNSNVDSDTVPYWYLGVPSDDIGFPFSSAYCQHLRQPPHKSHVKI
jgi:hypothetical protein